MIGHLRNPLRGNERRGFDGFQAGLGKQANEFDFCIGGDDLLFVLQPVTRADLDNARAWRNRHFTPLPPVSLRARTEAVQRLRSPGRRQRSETLQPCPPPAHGWCTPFSWLREPSVARLSPRARPAA